MKAYCEQQDVSVRADESPIWQATVTDTDTPAQLEMEDQDMIAMSSSRQEVSALPRSIVADQESIFN